MKTGNLNTKVPVRVLGDRFYKTLQDYTNVRVWIIATCVGGAFAPPTLLLGKKGNMQIAKIYILTIAAAQTRATSVENLLMRAWRGSKAKRTQYESWPNAFLERLRSSDKTTREYRASLGAFTSIPWSSTFFSLSGWY